MIFPSPPPKPPKQPGNESFDDVWSDAEALFDEQGYSTDKDIGQMNDIVRVALRIAAGSLATLAAIGYFFENRNYDDRAPILPEFNCSGAQYLGPDSIFYPRRIMPVTDFANTLPISGNSDDITANIIATNPSTVIDDNGTMLIVPNGNTIIYPVDCSKL